MANRAIVHRGMARASIIDTLMSLAAGLESRPVTEPRHRVKARPTQRDGCVECDHHSDQTWSEKSGHVESSIERINVKKEKGGSSMFAQ